MIITIGNQLNLKGVDLSRLSMPALTKIGSGMVAPDVDELDFPELISVGHIASGNKLKALNVPKLTSVPKGIELRLDPSANISFPSLTMLSAGTAPTGTDSDLSIAGGTSISAPVLSDCKSVSLGGQAKSVDLPAITSLDSFTYSTSPNYPMSPTITMNALTSITHINCLSPGSPHMSFPNLTSIGYGDITVAVGDVSFPKLTSIGYGNIAVAAGSFSAPNLISFGATPHEGLNTISADSFSAPKLTSLGGFIILSSVSSVDLGALQHVQNLTLSQTKLTELDLPALTSGEIALSAFGCIPPPDGCSTNTQLIQLKAPKWMSGQVFFADSTFPTCRASAICAQLGQSPSAGPCWCNAPSLCKQATAPCP